MKAALACVVLALASWAPAAQVAEGPTLEDLVARLNTAGEHYARTIRSLTAEETKVIEVFDADGRIEKRREIVSDVLVYQSARGGAATEYRDVKTVDGVPRQRRGERALQLLTRAARADSLRKELEAIDRETSRYEFRLHLRGMIVGQPRMAPDWKQHYDVAVAGRETVDGHETVLVTYRQTVRPPGSPRGLRIPGEFRDAPQLWRGWMWVDGETGRVWRYRRELTARHPAAAEPLVFIRADTHYTESRFGVMVPHRVVWDSLQRFSHEKGAQPALGLSDRVTFTYGEFRRFEVATSETIETPK